MLGISINIYIYSTVQNIKVLPPVVNKKAVVILNFHEAGEYYNTYIIERAAGGGREEEPTTIRFVRAIASNIAKNAHTSSYIIATNGDRRRGRGQGT